MKKVECYDTNGKYLGTCKCFPNEGEEHYFGETLRRYLHTVMDGCTMKFIFEPVVEDSFLNLIKAEIAKGPMKEFPKVIENEEDMKQVHGELSAYIESRILDNDDMEGILLDPLVIELTDLLRVSAIDTTESA